MYDFHCGDCYKRGAVSDDHDVIIWLIFDVIVHLWLDPSCEEVHVLEGHVVHVQAPWWPLLIIAIL